MTTLTITNTTISKLGGPGSCADAIVENSDASYTANVASGATLVVPDTDIENSDASYSVSVPSTSTLVVPDSNVSVNAVLQGQAVSVKPVNIQLTNGVTTVTPTSVSLVGNTVNIQVPAAVSRSTAKLMKTGQTTSYRTGDDGDIEAGRNVSFTVLAENNPFGNTNRFTDELGTQTYTKNIVVDWSTYDGSTVLGWRRTAGSGIWDTAIDQSLLVSIPPFTTGWRLPNIQEVFSTLNWGLANKWGYIPFSAAGVANIWTSNTNLSSTTRALYFNNTGLMYDGSKTGSTVSFFPCRTFTVTGTTLS